MEKLLADLRQAIERQDESLVRKDEAVVTFSPAGPVDIATFKALVAVVEAQAQELIRLNGLIHAGG